jgi:signal transduction histidine kinase
MNLKGPTAPNTAVQERSLALAEALVIFVACLTLFVFVANVPTRYDHLFHEALASAPALLKLGISPDFYAGYFLVFEVLSMLAYALVAALIFWRKSADWMAVFVALTLLTFGAAVPTPMHALVTAQPLGGWLGLFVQALGSGSFLIFFYLFLDGRFVPAWTRPLALLVAAWALAWPFIPLINPYNWSFPAPFVVFVAWFGTGVYAQIYRYRRVSTPEQRQQTKWVLFGLTIAVLGDFLTHLPKYIIPAFSRSGLPYVIYLFAHQPFFTLTQMLVPLTIGISIVRYRLWAINLIIKRALVYGLLTAFVIGTYVLVVGVLGALLQARSNFLLSILATGLVAVLFQPLRQRSHKIVNQLMYGQRDDPVAVLSQLGGRLAAIVAPQDVLPAIVETVTQALKLPYAAIALRDGEKFRVAVERGLPPTAPDPPLSPAASAGENRPPHTTVFPLVYHSERVGRLIVAPRFPGEDLAPADLHLLAELARQAGAAVYAVNLTDDLRRSRERLVTAREEERRRLRRDLHDELGPRLASLTFKLDAARNLLDRDPSTADRLLAELKSELKFAIADIRRLAHGLRPPALDQLGLLPALREVAAAQNAVDGLLIEVEAPGELPPLPAAVEVAAYRIALEALNNVARHARARRCTLHIALNAGLHLEVRDDGRGLPEGYPAGVGLLSMRERAAELGGEFEIKALNGRGTLVRAWLPVDEPE